MNQQQLEQRLSQVYGKKAKMISDIEAEAKPMLGDYRTLPNLNSKAELEDIGYEVWRVGTETIEFRVIEPYKPRSKK